MTSNDEIPSDIHPILKVMSEVVLPNAQNGVGRIISQQEREKGNGGCFSEVFPYGVHMHEYFEWVWMLESGTHINIEGTIHRMLPGDFCLLPPRTLHAELYTPVTQPYHSLWCYYHAEAVYFRLCYFNSVGRMVSHAYRAVQAPPVIGTLLCVLEVEMRKDQGYTGPVRHALLSSLAHLMMRALESSLTADETEGLPGFVERRVMSYLNRNYGKDASLDEVASAVGLSRNYLCSAFKRETGKTVGEALTAIRLERAKLLLLEENLSVQDVAAAVGYTSPAHFCRLFQRYERVAPSKYGKY